MKALTLVATLLIMLPMTHAMSRGQSTPIAPVAFERIVVPESGPVRERADREPELGLLEQWLPRRSDQLRVRGEWREQYESWRNREFGLFPNADDDYLLQRIYLDLEYRPNDWLRTLVELGAAHQFGSAFEPAPIDEDPAFIQQSMIDVLWWETQDWAVSTRVGRETYGLGSGRLVAIRNGPNIRRSFDGVRLLSKTHDLDSQILFGSEVEFGGDVFDNSISDNRLLWGCYHTLHNLEILQGCDLYYLGYRNQRAIFEQAIGEELRHSIGMRIFGREDDFDWNSELVAQLGEWNNRSIRAWTLANAFGYTLSSLKRSPRLGVKADIISGDDDPTDNDLGTFNAMFPNNSYFSEAAIFAPANLYDVNLNLDVDLVERLKLVVLWDFLWRYSKRDAVYIPPGIPVFSVVNSEERFIGNTFSSALEWRPSQSWEITASYVHFEPGQSVEDVGGREADFVLLWATLFF